MKQKMLRVVMLTKWQKSLNEKDTKIRIDLKRIRSGPWIFYR